MLLQSILVLSTEREGIFQIHKFLLITGMEYEAWIQCHAWMYPRKLLYGLLGLLSWDFPGWGHLSNIFHGWNRNFSCSHVLGMQIAKSYLTSSIFNHSGLNDLMLNYSFLLISICSQVLWNICWYLLSILFVNNLTIGLYLFISRSLK